QGILPWRTAGENGLLVGTFDARHTCIPKGRKAAHLRMGQGNKGGAFCKKDIHTCNTWQEQAQTPCNRFCIVSQEKQRHRNSRKDKTKIWNAVTKRGG